jgi:hypothetical protein
MDAGVKPRVARKSVVALRSFVSPPLGERRHQRLGLFDVVVGDLRRAAAVIEVRSDDEKVVVDVSIGDLADVIVHAKAFLENDERASGVGGSRDVDRESGRARCDAHSNMGPSVRVRLSS